MSRRCLLPAAGFFEWRRNGKEKQPFHFGMQDDCLFAFAGLWDRWRDPEGAVIESCSILTTTPNSLLADMHDRMPVILPELARIVARRQGHATRVRGRSREDPLASGDTTAGARRRGNSAVQRLFEWKDKLHTNNVLWELFTDMRGPKRVASKQIPIEELLALAGLVGW
jgi:hypothetical protein